MPTEKRTPQGTLMVSIVVLSVANILLTARIPLGWERLKSCEHRRESLPCQAVPTRFVIEEPECAIKLLRVMNVTNVHISSIDALDSPLNYERALRLQNLSEESR